MLFNPSNYIVHDLTHTYEEGRIAGYSDVPAKQLDVDGWNAKTLNIYSHSGTHMDAPLHFGVNKMTIDTFTPENVMGNARIARVNISLNKQLILIKDLGEIADKLLPGDSLLIQTKWSEHIEKDGYKPNLPRISKELAHWCVDKRVKILGVEPPSVADVDNMDEVTEIHQVLLGGNVVIVEGLTNISNIIKDQVFLIALPLKIKNGDGAPARVIAFEEK